METEDSVVLSPFCLFLFLCIFYSPLQFGWNKVDPMRPEFGRKSCEETKIAEGQILGARRP